MTAPAPTIDRPKDILTLDDRCDRCNSQAYARAQFGSSTSSDDALTLFFCGHHFNRHEPALRERAVNVVDERHRLAATVTN